jgi:hydroxylamine reductase (hybrid-cluster protein)
MLGVHRRILRRRRVSTVLAVMPRIGGSRAVTKLLTDVIEDNIKARFRAEPDPEKAALI